jgi:uncharacterized repeat protein (TIGR03837 family)
MRWDLFCRVIDNYGDIGVAWRLARDLAARGESVRLWLDDPAALAWMAPAGRAGIEIVHWTAEPGSRPAELSTEPTPGDVVVETFGCEPPAAFLEAMARRATPPVWIDLEYLSAEGYVERSHGLPSPQSAGPGRGLVRWFFYPGFSDRTGGLLREPGLLAERAAFDRTAWRAAMGIEARPGERLASLFCYDTAPLPALLQALADEPTLLLLTPGPAQRLAQGCRLPATVRTLDLPWLSQPGYDHLLWACDLNIVRGEDSFVRAMWAGTPFLWQIYPQHDGVHAAKLDAFLASFTACAGEGDTATAAHAAAACMRGWNGLQTLPATLPAAAAWRAACTAWRALLADQADLSTQLLGFARRLATPAC